MRRREVFAISASEQPGEPEGYPLIMTIEQDTSEGCVAGYATTSSDIFGTIQQQQIELVCICGNRPHSE